MAAELSVGYYLDNFTTVLDFVAALYEDLLTPEETEYRRRFQQLSIDARRLYVRLCARKGPLFRSDRLNYDEIDVAAAIEVLAVAGYVDFAPDASLEEVLRLLTRGELAALPETTMPASTTRARLVEDVLATACCDVIRERLRFDILRPTRLDILRVYRLLFFGNLQQDFTEFVLHELGISPYEQYTIHPEDRFFDSREVLDQTLALHQVAECVGEVMESNDVAGMVAAAGSIPQVDNEALKRRAARIRNRLARQFERLDQPGLALTLYEQSPVTPSRERRARIHDRQGNTTASLALCEDIIRNPQDEAEYEFAVSFSRRLLKREKQAFDHLPETGRNDFDVTGIAVSADPSLRVEELARQWYCTRGHLARYVENALFPGLFGLAFWDVIFAPRKGVFFNPFQRGPADLFAPAFKAEMEQRIAERMARLADRQFLEERLMETYSAKCPIANHFVNWNLLEPTLIEMALRRIPVDDILGVFRRLLRDLRRNRSGFPDLVVFPEQGGYLLAEIKGPGDTLQDNQKRWLRFFRDAGMPAQVVNVSWTDE